MAVVIPNPRIENGGELLTPGRKPVGNVVIDWSHPLSRGLKYCWGLNNRGGLVDLVLLIFPIRLIPKG